MANAYSVHFSQSMPHELKYHAAFEDSVMRVVLQQGARQDGIEVVMDEELEPQTAQAIRASDIDMGSLPEVHDNELPLPLSDPRRIYASAVPGIKLTHPGGYLEGGPGFEPDDDSLAREFLARHGHITVPEDLQAAIQAEVEDNLMLLEEHMRARQRAIQMNEQIEKEIQNMVDTHNVEYKVRQRLTDEAKSKREARERKRRDREGG